MPNKKENYLQEVFKQLLPALVVAIVTGLFTAVATFTALGFKVDSLAQRVQAIEETHNKLNEKIEVISNQVFYLYKLSGGGQ